MYIIAGQRFRHTVLIKMDVHFLDVVLIRPYPEFDYVLLDYSMVA